MKEFKSATVNELSVFESLKFYCFLYILLILLDYHTKYNVIYTETTQQSSL